MSRLYTGGPILPLAALPEPAEALLVDGARIADVGRLDRLAAAAPGAEHVDLAGRTLLPGLIDCHIHPVPFAFARHNVDVNPAASLDDLADLLRGRAADTPAGRWVVAMRLDEEKFADPRLPTRAELDAACPDHPVIVLRYCGHIGIANSRALAAAAVTADTPDPWGGRFDRDAAGAPNGILRETATQHVLGALAPEDPGETLDWIRAGFRELAANGLTTVCGIAQLGPEGPAGEAGAMELTAYEILAQEIRTRVCFLLISDDLRAVLDVKAKPVFAGTGGDYHFKIRGMKFFADGTFGGHTAVLHEPYADDPGNAGILRIEPEKWRDLFPAIAQAGLQVATHAIGDRMNDLILDLYAHAAAQPGVAGAQLRMEHASVLTRDAVRRFGELGVTASVQPPFVTSEVDWLEKRLGPDRARQAYPFRQLMTAGVLLCGGSDCPVEVPSPLWGMQSAVTRGGFQPQEALTAEEALRLYTSNAAEALGEADAKGTLEPGKLADLVILDENPLACAPDRLGRIGVRETIVAGETIYRANGDA